METNTNVIEVKNVSLSIKENKILNNINVSFERGKIHGLIGRNGSGKTVLLKCIMGFLKLDDGKVIVDDKVVGLDVDVINNAGIIIENPGFLPGYTGYQNLKFLAKLTRKIGKKEIMDAMTKVGLEPLSKKHVGKYSLGMRQRLGIAQAIMEDPDILILDEPMNGLDNQGVEDIRKLLLALKEQGKTILIASHNREDIDVLCDHVWEMDKGVATQVR